MSTALHSTNDTDDAVSVANRDAWIAVRKELGRRWSVFPVLFPELHVPNLRRRYESNDGPSHWFDDDTLRWFGSRNLHLHRAGLLVETQTKAPAGVGRYRVTAWVLDHDGPRNWRGEAPVVPVGMGTFDTLREARRFAEALERVWPA